MCSTVTAPFADGHHARTASMHTAAALGDASAQEQIDTIRVQDASRNARRNGRNARHASARVQAGEPKNSAECRLAIASREAQRAAAALSNTRHSQELVASLDEQISALREKLIVFAAMLREAAMWNPGNFHRSAPTTLHRSVSRARDDPPPASVECICQMPAETAKTYDAEADEEAAADAAARAAAEADRQADAGAAQAPLVDSKLRIYAEGSGKWLCCTVIAFDSASGEHKLLHDNHDPEEDDHPQTMWVLLSEHTWHAGAESVSDAASNEGSGTDNSVLESDDEDEEVAPEELARRFVMGDDGNADDAQDDADGASGAGAEDGVPAQRRRKTVTRYVAANAADSYEINDGHPTPLQVSSADVLALRRQASEGNVTWFHPNERKHPIFFWEQRVRCYFCGCDHFVGSTLHLRCCRRGELVLQREHSLPDAMLDLFAYHNGCSTSSREMNSMRRLCAHALPRGTHWHADRGGGMNVTGITYTILNNIMERGAARIFLDDPATRTSDRPGIIDEQLKIFDASVENNELFRRLRIWHYEPAEPSMLVLQWEGTTSALRSFAVSPSSAQELPRTTVILSRSEVDKRKQIIKATNDLYPLVMWPLAFPQGKRLQFADGAPVDDWLKPGGRSDQRNLNLQQSTLILHMQPERRGSAARGYHYHPSQQAPGSMLQVPTLSAYRFPEGTPECDKLIWRRANRFALLGKLADEFLLDRWNSVMDHRRDMLSRPAMQRRLTAQLGAAPAEEDMDVDVAADAAEAGLPARFADDNGEQAWEHDAQAETAAQTPSYLPPSEEGTPRNQREKMCDALYLSHEEGSPLTFITSTCNVRWPEITTRLPAFDKPLSRRDEGDPRVLTTAEQRLTTNYKGVTIEDHDTRQKTSQNVYEATALHAEVYEMKHKSLNACVQSGIAFRNVGRPKIVDWRSENVTDAAGSVTQIRIPQYAYPLSIDRQEDGTQGYDIGATEFQKRNLAHAHHVTRPATVPVEWKINQAAPGMHLTWVDLLTCARLPTRTVLVQFSMIDCARSWRVLDGVCRIPQDPSGGLYKGYEYLSPKAITTTYKCLSNDANGPPFFHKKPEMGDFPLLADDARWAAYCTATALWKDYVTSPDVVASRAAEHTPYDDNDPAVHPDIVHDFGPAFEDPNVLLDELTRCA